MPTHPFWSAMPPAMANEILVSTQRDNKKLYRTLVEIMAPALNRRVPKILEMPKIERHAAFVQLLSRPESEAVSFNLLSQWLVREHGPMLCCWLDALQIPHDNAGCTDRFPSCPSPAVLRAGIDKLLETHDPGLVAIYLTTFNEIEEVHWQPLADALKADPRLRFGPAAKDPRPIPAREEEASASDVRASAEDSTDAPPSGTLDAQAAAAVKEDDDPEESPAVSGSSIHHGKSAKPVDPITGT